jgi:hypothetical protein
VGVLVLAVVVEDEFPPDFALGHFFEVFVGSVYLASCKLIFLLLL